eukprot:14652642-Heterocapsa_arctica.AAC.1
MENGKDKRADMPCLFQAAGHCKLGDECPWNHIMKPGKTAAAPSGETMKKGQQICRCFLET